MFARGAHSRWNGDGDGCVVEANVVGEDLYSFIAERLIIDQVACGTLASFGSAMASRVGRTVCIIENGALVCVGRAQVYAKSVGIAAVGQTVPLDIECCVKRGAGLDGGRGCDVKEIT